MKYFIVFFFVILLIAGLVYSTPSITIDSPTNTTYNTSSIDLKWSANETINWSAYSLDGGNNITLCYQETANVSTACGGLSTGAYSAGGNWIDEDWNTYTLTTTEYVNYSLPSNTGDADWETKATGFHMNNSLPSSCIKNPVELKIEFLSGPKTRKLYCRKSDLSWYQLHSSSYYSYPSYGYFYEEAMWWGMTAMNTTLTGLSEGSHNVIVWANDSSGNMNSSQVYFTVNSCGFPSSGNKTLDLNLNCTYNNENINIDYLTFENSGDITFTDSTLLIKGLTTGMPTDSRIILINSSYKTLT